MAQSLCWLKIKCKTVIGRTWILECYICWKTFFPLSKNLVFGRDSVLAEVEPCPSFCCWNPPWQPFPLDSLESSSASSGHQVSLRDWLSSGTFGCSLSKSSSADSRGGLRSAHANVEDENPKEYCVSKVHKSKIDWIHEWTVCQRNCEKFE